MACDGVLWPVGYLSFLSNVAFNGLANGTDLNSVCAVNCEIYVKNIQITYIHTYIHAYIHTYIHTWPKPVFHRLLDFGFAPSARSLRLNYHYGMWWRFMTGPGLYYERPRQRPWVVYTGEKSWAAGRPAVVTLFERLFLWNVMTNSRTVNLIRCHHPINHVFNRYRYPTVPTTAGERVPGRGCRRHPLHR